MPKKTTDRAVQAVSVTPQFFVPSYGAAKVWLHLPERRADDDHIVDQLRMTLLGPKGGIQAVAYFDTDGLDRLITELKSYRKEMVP